MPPRDFLSHLGKALNGRRVSEADIHTDFAYVRPLDKRGLAVVKRLCNDQEIVVSNLSGVTFAPGAGVMVGTNTNRPGKAIIAPPPPGRMGASRVPVDYAVRTYGTAPEEPSACPTSRTGRSYLGIVDEEKTGGGGGAETLWAYRYTDGGYIETLASYDYSGDGITLSSDPAFQRVHTDGDVVIFSASGLGADLLICTWDIDANTLAIADFTHPQAVNAGSPAIWNGSGHAFFFVNYGSSNPRTLQMYRVAIGSSGTVNEVTAQIGSTLATHTASGLAPGGNMCHSGSDAFQVPCLYYGGMDTEVAIAYFDGSGWDAGLSRDTFAAPADMGNGNNGFGISGGRSLRITYGPSLDPPAVLGVIPAAPATPETSLLPADWLPAAYYSLAVSPNGTEFAVKVDEDGNTVDQILRLGVADSFALAGCPIPSITIEASPEGFVPQIMLCRDN